MSAQPRYTDLLTAMHDVVFTDDVLSDEARATLMAVLESAIAAHPEHRTRERAGRNQSLRLAVERLKAKDPQVSDTALARRLAPCFDLSARQARRVVLGS